MASQAKISRRWPVTAIFYTDEISFVRVTKNTRNIETQERGQEVTAKEPQGIFLQGEYLKCAPMTADQFQTAYHSFEYENNLRDIYFEVTLNREADEQLANELFQAFGALIAVKFKNDVFTRTGL